MYRNLGFGVKLDYGDSISIRDGDFSDNRRHIYAHRSENITVEDSSIVGMSSEHRLLEDTQSSITKFCPNRQTQLTGIEIQSFTRFRNGNGVTVNNVGMSGFSDLLCRENAFRVSPEVRTDDATKLSSLRVF